MKTNYDGKRYWCTLCKVVCLKSKNINKHFLSERHVKATVEKQGKVFDPEIMKQQEPKKEKPQTKDISEVLKYVCSTKQTAKKENNDIYISSLTDCTVKITDFTTEQDFMGSEFVKAVSGFKCQLCKIFMRHGHQIIEHLKGKKHYTNYKKYLKENPDYLDNQRVVNKNLVDMLKKDEGKEVVLQENNGNTYKAGDADLNSTLEEKGEEADFSMDEYDPNEDSKVDDDDSKMADESSFNDSAINDSIQDHSLVESEKETEENKTEETEEKTEAKEIEEENDVEKKEIEKEEVEKEEVEKEEAEKEEVEKEEAEVEKEDLGAVSEAKDKEFSMEADEEEEEFPLLQPPTNPIKEDETIEPEVKANPEVEAKIPEVDTEPKESETPSEPAAEPEEAEEVTPSRRGRKSKRGRGGTKARGGRRTTPRAAKNAKKIEKVVEPEEEVVDAPMETEKEQEKEGEPVVPLAQVGTDSAEELPSSQETEEIVSPQKSTGNGVDVDGFEVIDEVEGGSGDDSEDDD
ncbi:Zinc finger 318 [Paramuricea clavata]|uniref:Zinc finger 318 n=2 Tax=Paramuricea clavata TaxID=317549 RepID=A0A7D9ISC0_PARCT|nr:Zinc finger 318 [Paramuricea clavata]